ncbi:MAG: hypothetical protein ACK5YG_04650 [Alphaproteobacteria bacterium]
MRFAFNQFSFAGGELSPRLYGRSDLQKYASGAELVSNFVVRPEGGLVRRHGTRFAGAARDATGPSRLIPFVFSTVQAYMLEFAGHVMRVWKDGAQVTHPTRPIMHITQASPARVTVFDHGLVDGDRIILAGIRGMGALNNRSFVVTNADTDSFALAGVDATGLPAWTGGGTVARILEVATPFAADDLAAIGHAQSADVLYLVHPAHPPHTLTRTAHDAWTLAPLPLDRGPFAPQNPDDTRHVMCLSPTGRSPGAQVTVRASAPLFTPAHAGSTLRLQEIHLADPNVSPWAPGETITATVGLEVSSNGHVYALADAGSGSQTGTVAPAQTEGDAWDNPAGAANRKKWRYLHSRWAILRLDAWIDSKTMRATTLTHLPSGLAPAALPIAAITNAGGRCRVTAPGHGFDEGDIVAIEGVPVPATANGDWKVVNVTPATFELNGAPPPAGPSGGGTVRRYATWSWAEGAFSSARGYPACVALHEQRLVLANTRAQPFGLWASASADFANFLPGSRDDETIAYNIAANQADPVRWLTSASDLLIGTLAQEFAAFGGGLGDPITPSNTRIVPQSGEGASDVQPVKVGLETIFVNRTGRKIVSLASRPDAGGYVATDLTELAEHLVRESPVTRLAWARNPLSVLWALRADGKVLSLTYRPEQQLYAWTRHDFGGRVESIATIPGPGGATDDLWLVVCRTIAGEERRSIEILAPPFEPADPDDKDDMGYLDSALRYRGAPVSALSGLFHLEGATVAVVADGALHPSRIVASGAILLERPAMNVWVGLAYESSLRTLRLDVLGAGFWPGRSRRVSGIWVRVHNTIGGEAGLTGTSTREPLARREATDRMDASPPLRSGDIAILPSSDFDPATRITLVQAEALPLDVLSVSAMVAMGEAAA